MSLVGKKAPIFTATAVMPDNELLYEVNDHVACFTINREAQRNSISARVVNQFLEQLDVADAASAH